MDETFPLTLDDIEAWWLAHPWAFAQANHCSDCLVGLPLQARYGEWITVHPHHPPTFSIYADSNTYNTEHPAQTIPLPAAIARLAQAFDARFLPPEHEPEDDFDRDLVVDDPCPTVPGPACIAFINDYRAAHKED